MMTNKPTGHWDCGLVINYLEEKQKNLKDNELQQALNTSGLDSGEGCVKWMVKHDINKLSDFWVGEKDDMFLTIERQNEKYNPKATIKITVTSSDIMGIIPNVTESEAIEFIEYSNTRIDIKSNIDFKFMSQAWTVFQTAKNNINYDK